MGMEEGIENVDEEAIGDGNKRQGEKGTEQWAR